MTPNIVSRWAITTLSCASTNSRESVETLPYMLEGETMKNFNACDAGDM